MSDKLEDVEALGPGESLEPFHVPTLRAIASELIALGERFIGRAHIVTDQRMSFALQTQGHFARRYGAALDEKASQIEKGTEAKDGEENSSQN